MVLRAVNRTPAVSSHTHFLHISYTETDKWKWGAIMSCCAKTWSLQWAKVHWFLDMISAISVQFTACTTVKASNCEMLNFQIILCSNRHGKDNWLGTNSEQSTYPNYSLWKDWLSNREPDHCSEWHGVRQKLTCAGGMRGQESHVYFRKKTKRNRHIL